MPEKLRTGLNAYCARWPGEVVLITSKAPPSNASSLGMVSASTDDLPFLVQSTNDIADAARRVKPDLTVLPLDVRSTSVRGAVRRAVVTVEHSAASRCRMAAVDSTRRDRVRIWSGWAGLEVKFTKLLKSADGVQFNGWPSYLEYGRRVRNSMVFFDTRLESVDLPPVARLRKSGRLRLAFSGRLIPIKGAVDAAQAASRIWEAGLLERFDIFGSGPQEAEMRKVAPPGTIFHGSVPFRSNGFGMCGSRSTSWSFLTSRTIRRAPTWRQPV